MLVRFVVDSVETEWPAGVNRGALRIVETVAAGIDCVIALVLGVIAGLRIPIGQPWIVLGGLVLGEVCAGIYLGLANLGGRMWHGKVDSAPVGGAFMGLV